MSVSDESESESDLVAFTAAICLADFIFGSDSSDELSDEDDDDSFLATGFGVV